MPLSATQQIAQIGRAYINQYQQGGLSSGAPSIQSVLGGDLTSDIDQAITRHRIWSVVYSVLPHLADSTAAAQPATTWLDNENQRNVERVTKQALVTKLIEREFTNRGLYFTVIKGLPLAEKLYHHTAHRHSKDIDLLVAPQDIEAAKDALTALGFKQKSFGALPDNYEALYLLRQKDYTFVGRGVVIELHVRLSPVNLPVTEHYRASALSRDENVTERQLAELLYLCYHGSTFGVYARFKWLIDIALYLRLPSLQDPSAQRRLRELAARLGAMRYLIVSWELAHLYLEAARPRWILDELRADPVARYLVRRAPAGWESDWLTRAGVVGWFQGLQHNLYARVMLTPKLNEKSAILVHHFFCPTPGDLYQLRFIPAKLYFLHWLLRPLTVTYRKLRPSRYSPN